MRIQIRVINQAAKELQQVAQGVRSVSAAQKAGAGQAQAMSRFMNRDDLERYGKNLQWTGRQIEYNFTLPILAAAAAGTKFNLDNERAFTRLQKVYGDGSMSVLALEKDLGLLRRGFRALSDTFGVHQDEVIGIGAAWAAAGAQGYALAQATKLTLQTMILGEMEATEATEALIAIQGQYNLSSQELIGTMAQLNAVENRTAAQFKDLVQGFQRAAGSARTAGVDTRHLAAMIAALVPAAGSAAKAGNSIRTVLSRILAPTADATELFEKMGISVNGAWKSMTGTQRLEVLGEKFNGLADAQKAVVSAFVGSRYQITSFDILMREVTSTTGRYADALRATEGGIADNSKVMEGFRREVGIFLASSPQGFSILTTRLQNLLAEAMVPLLPVLTAVLTRVVALANKFTSMDPAIQQLIIGLLLGLAVFGTLQRYIGASILLFVRFGGLVSWLGKAFGFLAVTTEMSDGSIEKHRGGLLRWAKAALAMPFKFLFGGYKMLIGVAMSAVMPLYKVGAIAGKSLWLLVVGMRKIGGPLLRAATGIVGGVGGVFGKLSGIMGKAGFRGAVSFSNALTFLPKAVNRVGVGIAKAMLFASTAFGRHAKMMGGMLAKAGVGMASIAARGALLVPGIFSRMTLAMDIIFQRLPIFMGKHMRAGAQAMMRGMMALGGFMGKAAPAIVGGVGRAMAFLPKIAMIASTGMARAMMLIGVASARVGPTVGRGMTAAVLWMRTSLASMWKAGKAFVVGFPKMWVTMGPKIIAALTSPWTFGIAAVLAIMWIFRDKIREAITDVIKYFQKTPGGIVGAIKAIVGVIKAGALAAYEWLSYLNPFARHSPSLVEQVNAGVSLISRAYGSLADIGGNFRRAIKDLDDFKKATGTAMGAAKNIEIGELRTQAMELDPTVGPAFDNLSASVKRLYGDLYKVGMEFAKQEQVTMAWKVKLDAANASLDTANNRLDELSKVADAARDRLDAAKDTLDRLTETPIAGMGAMSDAIFNNSLEANKLRLEMMKWEEVNGPIQEIESRLAGLNGQIETVRATQAELRNAGAGSDVLGAYDAEVKALEDQKNALNANIDPILQMQAELERLGRQGEMLDLENSITFDPLLRQIEQLTNTMPEIPFDDLLTQIKAQQNEVARLTSEWDQADAAVRQQQTVVNALTVARDAMAAGYDKEKAALDALGESYDAIEAQIRAMEQAMQDFATASQSARMKSDNKTQAGDAFDAAAGGNFPEAGGLGDMGNDGDLAKLVADWEAESALMFKGLDMFAPFKDMFTAAWKWIDVNLMPYLQPIIDKVRPALQPLVDEVKGLFAGGVGDGLKNVGGKIANIGRGPELSGDQLEGYASRGIAPPPNTSIWEDAGGKIKDIWGSVMDFLTGPKVARFLEILGNIGSFLVDSIMPSVRAFGELIGSVFRKAVDELGPELARWGALFEPLGRIVKGVFIGIAAVVAVALAAIMLVWNAVWPMLIQVLKPILDFIVRAIRAVLTLIRGIITLAMGLILGDWAMIWEGMKTIVAGIWHAIYAVIAGVFGIIWGVIWGALQGIANLFMWLYDVLVGHSIIPDMVNAILAWFQTLFDVAKGIFDFLVAVIKTAFEVIATVAKWLWENVLQPVWNAIKWYAENILVPMFEMIGRVVETIFRAIGAVIGWVWENVIKQVWGGIKWYAENVLAPVFGWVKDRVGDAFNGIGSIVRTVWDTVVKPIWDGIKWYIENVLGPVFTTLKTTVETAFNGIKTLADTVWGGIKDAVVGAVNLMIKAINGLIGGLRTLGGLLDIGSIKNLPNIPELATGGAVGGGGGSTRQLAKGGPMDFAPVGAGFKTNGPKAIVGEGKRTWPEYVIPTDPHYRSRAQMLLGEANQKIKMFAAGGAMSGEDVGVLGHKVAGWKGNDLATGIAVSKAESGWNPRAYNGNRATGDMSFGLYQINMLGEMGPERRREHNLKTNDDLFDPKINTRVAGAMQRQQGWGPWSTYDRNEHKKYMGEAQGIAKKIETGNGGGLLNSLGNVVDAPVDFVVDQVGGKTAAMLFDAAAAVARRAIDAIPVPPVRDVGHGLVNTFGKFVKDREAKLAAELGGQAGNLAGDAFTPRGGYGGRQHGVLSENTSNAIDFIREKWGLKNVGGLGDRANASDHPYGKALDAMVMSNASMGTNIARYFAKNNGEFGTKYVIWYDQINSGGGWRPYTHPSGQTNTTLAHRDHVHVSFLQAGGALRSQQNTMANNIPALGDGGIARATAGGRVVRVAEAGRDEAIIPLPASWKQGGESKSQSINFYGDLSFPNVTNGDDAEAFVKNLESLV